MCIRDRACWAHFRRKIFENHQTSPTPLTTDLLERIGALYRIEDEVRGQPPDIRRQWRQEKARPLVDDLRSAIDDALRRLSPKSAMPKAVTYGRKRWIALARFVDDGRAKIDNNIAERAMRSAAIGRNYAKRRIMRRCRRRVQLLHQSRRHELHIITTTAGSSSDCRRLGSGPARQHLVAASSEPVPSSRDRLRRTYGSLPYPRDRATGR